MIVLGVILLIVAVVCVILGLAVQAVNFLLWVGVGLVVVGVLVFIYERFGHRKLP